MALISIIVPVYQVERYIKECIESVRWQSYSNWEMILVDDGSRDSSGKICEQYSQLDKRIKVIHKENGGLSDARNKGFEQAIGDYVVFLDSDDYWLDKLFLEKISKHIEHNPQVEVILFEAKRLLEDTKEFVKDNKLDVNFINNNSRDEIVKNLIISKTYSMSACTKVIKREFIVSNELLFKKNLLGEDLDWFLKVILNVRYIGAIESINYIYRVRKGSITQMISLKNIEDQFWILNKWIPIIQNNKEIEEYKKYYLGILAYSYVIDMLLYSQLKKEDQEKVEQKMKEYAFLLKYDVNKIISITKIIYRILGLRLTAYLLKRYYFSKK